MTRFVGLLLIVCLGVVANAQAQTGTADALAQAQRAYTAGDYTAALALYEQVLAQGSSHPVVYFNVATTHEAQEQVGWALLYYFKAQQGMPRDVILTQRIMQIQATRLDVQQEETVIIDRLGVLVSGIVTTGELASAGFSLWLVWFGLATSGIIRPVWREGLRPVLVVLGVVMLSVVLLLGARLFVENYRPLGVVVTAQAEVYSGPGEAYLQLFTLSEAAELRGVNEQPGWVRVILPDGRRGWVQQGQVVLVTHTGP